MKDKIESRELICMNCGYITYNYRDMVEHLACTLDGENYYRTRDENCIKKVIEYGELKNKDKIISGQSPIEKS